MTNKERAENLINDLADSWGDDVGNDLALVLAFSDEIRRECADRFCKDCQDKNPVTCSHLENGRICRWVAVIIGKD